VAAKAGAYAGKKKYGDAANLPAQLNRAAAATKSRARKPTLDEMGPGMESRIFQPKSMREGGQEHSGRSTGPSPRSSGGAPGKRGGWKKR
jgi:excinuclease ABC subunit B